jgi:hypothetical protein
MGYKTTNHRPAEASAKTQAKWENANLTQDKIVEFVFLGKKRPLTRTDVEAALRARYIPMLNTSVVRAIANLHYGVENPGDYPAKWRIKPCLVVADTVPGIYGRPVSRWIHKKYYKEWKKNQSKK